MEKSLLASFIAIIMIGFSFMVLDGDAIFPENLPEQSQAPYHVRVIEGENLTAFARPLYTSPDNPSNHEVPTSNPHDGVARLILDRTDGTFGCTGTLADDKIHVFTAAHCVADDFGNYILTSGTATFEGNSGSVVIAIDANPVESKVHPDYDGDFIKGNDIAILKLVSSPPGVPGIPHSTSGNAVGLVTDKVGYGLSGFFSSGDDSSTYPFGIKRDGQNKYDAFGDIMYLELGLTSGTDFTPGTVYQYDSDDGVSKHDAFGYFFGISNLGLGNDEVISSSGDSGGPTFVNGKLEGITSYGITLQYNNKQSSDCTKFRGSIILDSSCGEFAGDTRVSQYTNFIDSVLNDTTETNDSDGDSFDDVNQGGTDCDDADDTIYPGATETAYDGIDSNCDGLDPNDVDLDGSIANQAIGGSPDCDDTDNAVYPGAPELADGKDNDCDGETDEGTGLFCDNLTIDDLLNSERYTNIIDNRGGPSTTLTGSDGNDLIIAGDFGDTLFGELGHDCLIGGSGDDTINGYRGSDQIFGQGGADFLVGAAHADIIYGGTGNDTLKGKNGHDTLVGDSGNDGLDGGGGTDTCVSDAEDVTPPLNCEL